MMEFVKRGGFSRGGPAFQAMMCNARQDRWSTWLMPLLIISIVVSGTATGVANARVLHGGPADYSQQVESLRPGDELRLEPGIYRGGLRLHGIEGSSGDPIVIVGPVSGPQAVFVAQNGSNTISLKDVAFVTIRNLMLKGRARNADAIKAEGTSRYAHHITLENLFIRNYDRDQQIVGISTKCPAWDWVVRGNTIENAGTGMYFGSSDGSAPFIGGLIERNFVHGTIGYNMEIKRQNPRPALPGIPTKSRVTIIRDNIFTKANGGSTGIMARPNVLVGAWPLKGVGRDDRYLVYGNLFYQNPTEALFQATGRVAVYSNLFFNTVGVGKAVTIMRHHGRAPENVEVFHNTIVAKDLGVGVWNAAPDGRQWVAANAIFAARPTRGRMKRSWNAVGDMRGAGAALRAPFACPDAMDLSPQSGQLVSSDVPEGALVNYPEAGKDFAGRPWTRGMAGAYVDAAPASPPAGWQRLPTNGDGRSDCR